MAYAATVAHGITVAQLASYFRTTRKVVQTKLESCEPIGTGRQGALLYNFVEAVGYLVPPKTKTRDWLKTITDKDLPQELREGFWNAKIKEMKARVMAGDLWPTASVLEVLGETFKTIKNTTQLWVDEIDEGSKLSNEQREILMRLVDKLRAELHQSLVAQASASATESFARGIDDDEA